MASLRTRRLLAATAAVLALAALAAGAWYWRESTRWFTATELDRPAAPAGFINPDFPAAYGRQGYLGHLRIDVYINAKGAVDHVNVVESTLPPVFGERATQAFLHAKFEPARRFGRAVRSVKRLQLDIEPPAAGEAEGSSRGVKR